jgi:hypothetical protein
LDCSAYVGYVLKLCAPVHYDTIHNGGAQHGPSAVDFYNRFVSLPSEGAHGWRPVGPIADARRGDIVAWKLDASPGGDDTGHVFFVVDKPKLFEDGVIAVRVHDSSDVIHSDDSRGRGGDAPSTGLGTGTIHFHYVESEIQFQSAPATRSSVPLSRSDASNHSGCRPRKILAQRKGPATRGVPRRRIGVLVESGPAAYRRFPANGDGSPRSLWRRAPNARRNVVRSLATRSGGRLVLLHRINAQ